jgi:DNA invertase Pin-like site-specific DNA recombinase
MLGVNACFCQLLPRHPWPLWSVHLDELRFCRASGEGKEARALSDVSTSGPGPCPCLGQSGAKDSRPELNKLMGDARKRKFDAIVVWRFDQFARSTKHLLLALEEFRSLAIQFISYQENMDTSSPLGQARFTIVSAVTQLERDLIRERVSAGIRNARACGKQLGRPRRVANHDDVRRLRSGGASLRQIAAKLGVGYCTVRLRLRNA